MFCHLKKSGLLILLRSQYCPLLKPDVSNFLKWFSQNTDELLSIKSPVVVKVIDSIERLK